MEDRESKREELNRLEAAFAEAGGRGVELADRIDALRADIEAGVVEQLRADCEYSDGEDGDESGVEELIAYKDALEDRLGFIEHHLQAEIDRDRDAFLRTMLEDFNSIGLGLGELEALYEEKYDEIWLAGDGLAEDNERHETDDLHQGRQEGLRFALSILRGEQVPS